MYALGIVIGCAPVLGFAMFLAVLAQWVRRLGAKRRMRDALIFIGILGVAIIGYTLFLIVFDREPLAIMRAVSASWLMAAAAFLVDMRVSYGEYRASQRAEHQKGRVG